jgi:3-deoxy-D-manno-octulosonic-acid transferase
MVALYNIGILVLRTVYMMAAWFNPKARTFRNGRLDQVSKMLSTFPLPPTETLVWFHCASLGEFEQGRPIIEALKAWRPSLRILLTFFSPSGYEIRKNYEHADYVFYLPWDTSQNAKWFAETVKPSLTLFVKYEFWYHYSVQLHKHNIPLLSISSIFRPDQIFFKPHGSLFRSMLKCFSHFFVQNQQSVTLLHSIGIKSVTLAGDTRFDRVNQIVRQGTKIPTADQFKAGQKVMVVGSAWPEDMEVLFPFINENTGQLKFIVAPHEISEDFLLAIEKSIQGKTIRYSQAKQFGIEGASVLLIDNIGMLSQLYPYGDFAFVGGAFGAGLHNILEAACCGIPVFFGNKAFQKYQEAVDLVFRGGAFEVRDYVQLRKKFEEMMRHPETYTLACEVTRHYVLENLGASSKIVDACKKYLS